MSCWGGKGAGLHNIPPFTPTFGTGNGVVSQSGSYGGKNILKIYLKIY